MAARKKLRAIWDNRFFDTAALTPSSEVATLPARNVQDPVRQRPWRTTGLNDQFLIADLGTPTNPEDVRPAITALVLINHNLTRHATVTLQAAPTNDFSAPLLSETHNAWADIIGAGEGGAGGPPGAGGVIFDCHRAWYAPNPMRIIYLNIPLEAKGWWKLSFSDPGNPDGYLQVGRIFLTYFDEYKYDWAYPFGLGGEDDSTITYNPGGTPWTDKREFRRRLNLGWNERFSDEDLFWRFYFMLMKVGKSSDWVIDPIPEGVSSRHFTSLYGRFQDIPDLSQWAKGLSDLEITFIESL
ncbi:MAG: hypothetical protein FJ121_09010 [Deltaproteobacteria bacterium]|nr:hypothetical protein [Deltaproteobacteria bacterium]